MCIILLYIQNRDEPEFSGAGDVLCSIPGILWGK